jgi:hypothetical protein
MLTVIVAAGILVLLVVGALGIRMAARRRRHHKIIADLTRQLAIRKVESGQRLRESSQVFREIDAALGMILDRFAGVFCVNPDTSNDPSRDPVSSEVVDELLASVECALARWTPIDAFVDVVALPEQRSVGVRDALRRLPGASAQDTDRRSPSSVVASLRSAAAAIDLHFDQRQALERSMAELGLDRPSPELFGWTEYEEVRQAQRSNAEHRLAECKATILAAVGEARLAFEHDVGLPGRTTAIDDADLEAAIIDFRAELESYCNDATTVLLEGKRLRNLSPDDSTGIDLTIAVFETATADLETADRAMAAGDLPWAIASMANTPLPVVPSWPPAASYELACESVVRRLSAADGDQVSIVQSWSAAARPAFDGVIQSFSDAVRHALDEWERKEHQDWRHLDDAARTVRAEIASTFVAALEQETSESPTVGASLRTAATSLVIHDRAAKALHSQFADWTLLSPSTAHARSAELQPGERVLRLLDSWEQRVAPWGRANQALEPSVRHDSTGVKWSRALMRIADLNGSQGRRVSALVRRIDGARADVRSVGDEIVRADVVHEMLKRLELDAEPVELPSWVGLDEARRNFPDAARSSSRRCSEALVATAERAQSTLSQNVGSPRYLIDEIGVTGDELLGAFRRATQSYVDRLRAVLSDALPAPTARTSRSLDYGPAMERLAEIEALARSDKEGSSIEAIGSLASSMLPSVPGWSASNDYAQFSERAAERLVLVTDEQRIEIVEWTKRSLDVFGDEAAPITEELRNAVRVWHDETRAAASTLADAAASVIREAVERLDQPADDGDPDVAVGAAAMAVATDERAALNIYVAAREAIPTASSIGDATSASAQNDRIDNLVQKLDGNAMVFAAVDGLLMHLFEPSGVDGVALSHAMANLAGLPADAVHASANVFSFLHSPDLLRASTAGVSEFVRGSVQNLSPHLQVVLHQGFGAAINSVSASAQSFHGSLIGQLLTQPEHASQVLTDYLRSEAVHGGFAFARSAAMSHQIQAAEANIEHASHQLLGGLHGLGHLPWVTIVFSMVRETRAVQQHRIAPATAVAHVGGDAAAVTAGSFAANHALAIVGLHSPLAPVVGAAVALSIWRRHRHTRQMHELEQAVAQYDRDFAAYESAMDAAATSCGDRIAAAVNAERTLYLAELEKPKGPSDIAGPELEAILRKQADAMWSYLDLLGAMASQADQFSALDGASPSDTSQLQSRVESAWGRIRSAMSEGRDVDPIQAIAALTEAQLPSIPSWAPTERYRAVCIQTATRIRDLGDEQREQTAVWAHRSADHFRSHNEEIGAKVSSSMEAYTKATADAWKPVEAAYEVVKRDAAVLGLTMAS